MESPFLEICKQQLAKALGKLPQLWSQPWREQEVGLETSRDPPYFCSDFMSQARKKCHSSQNLVHLYSLRIVPIFLFHTTSILAMALHRWQSMVRACPF